MPHAALKENPAAFYTLRHIDEVKATALKVAAYFPRPTEAHYGIHELILNAHEHGNLSITCDEKTELLKSGTWMEEVLRRQALPENAAKKVEIFVSLLPGGTQVLIQDDGAGFDWRPYLLEQFKPRGINGMGIYTAFEMSFTSLEYIEPGNAVVASYLLD